MSVSGLQVFLGGEGAGAVSAARPKVAVEHVLEAERLRAQGWGWQNIARVVGIERDTLRRAVERGLGAIQPPAVVVIAPPAGDVERSRRSITLRPHMQVFRALEGLEAEGASHAGRELAEVIGLSLQQLSASLGTARMQGWVQLASSGVYSLTPEGVAAMAEARGRVTQTRRVIADLADDGVRGVGADSAAGQCLRLVVAGVGSPPEMARRLEAAPYVVSTALNRLKQLGLVASSRVRGNRAHDWSALADGRAVAVRLFPEIEGGA